jgi:hypothetical protein
LTERIVLRLEIPLDVVRDSDDCWIYQGPKSSTGYGTIGLTSLHRLSFEHHNGPLGPGEVVRHSCDKPACWNPEHLIKGTRSDNSRDMFDRGRGGKQRLTVEDVRAIRSRYNGHNAKPGQRTNAIALAREYGITRAALTNAAKGRTFNWVV